MLFIQEHWLSDGQLPILNNLSTSHCSFSVCGFNSDEVLQGRPYGGCAILWRQGFCHDIVFLDSGSRRVCAIRCSFDFGNVVFINCYMPYESNDLSRAEFSNHLEVIKCILEGNGGCHVIIGGDFNVDINRDWANTAAFTEFCSQLKLYPVINHRLCSIDYTYNFSMKRFSVVDHFVISEQLYCESVTEVCVYHEVDNTSDHEPIGLKLHVDAQQYSTQSRSFVSKVAWNKAKQQDLDAYSHLLRDNLAQLDVPYSAVTVCVVI